MKVDAKDMDRNERVWADNVRTSMDAAQRPKQVESDIQAALDGAEAVPSDIHATLAERGSRYGDFRDHAAVTQMLKDIMRQTAHWSAEDTHVLTSMHREALEMIQHKIGRILCGDPNYDDSWRDIAGYATLVLDRLPKGDAK